MSTVSLSFVSPMLLPFVPSSPEEKEKDKNAVDAFKISIQQFVSTIEMEPKMKLSITSIRERFQFQRRRLYDVINVLEAIGCCIKTGIDTIIWLGLKNVKPSLYKLTIDNHVFDEDASINEVIQNDPSISISKLTQQFLLSFFALNEHYLDIKAISHYVTRMNGRYKSTLCKLYQISHILESACIIEKSDVPGVLHLRDEYYVSKVVAPKPEPSNFSLLSIENLLNRQQPKVENYVSLRRKEFLNFCSNDKDVYFRFLDSSSYQSPIQA